jgi:hypothetical protein
MTDQQGKRIRGRATIGRSSGQESSPAAYL